MSDGYEVVVYGASGYTGKLIAWKLAGRGIPFIAAGRSQKRLKEQMARVPELKGAKYKCEAVKHDKKALTELFRGKKIVYNVAGPFWQLGGPVVQACLAAGCHYLDTTGEQDWIIQCREQWGKAFKSKDLLLAPAFSWMWTAGHLAAEICLETPGVDSLDMLYFPNGSPSVASTQSFLRMCVQTQYFLDNKQLVRWPDATGYDVTAPHRHRIYKALPWGGGAEPIWYQHDPRVRNCQVLTTFENQIIMMAVIDKMKEFGAKYGKASRDEQERVTNAWGSALTTAEPDRDDPLMHRVQLSCFGRGTTAARNVIFKGSCGYTQTAVIAAAGTERILANKLLSSGFASPAQAFGARNLIGDLAEDGTHCTVDRAGG